MSSPSIPDPNAAARQGVVTSAELYPFQYLVSALSQEGGAGTIANPITGQPQGFDFTGLGTADVQNQTNAQQAQNLLDLQNQFGPQYVQQALQDWQQSDPAGFSDYNQLYDTIQGQVNAPVPGIDLATGTQNDILDLLNKGATLDPTSQMQVEQGVRGGQVGNGIYLGNAPVQQEAEAVVGAGDQQQAASEGAASNFLASGVDPTDIQYRSIQQDLANLGAFVNGQTPEGQFGSISGAQSGAAPQSNTGYSVPGINEGQAAGSGVNNAFDLYNIENQNTVNPFVAGLSGAANIAGTAFNLGYSPWNQQTTNPFPASSYTTPPYADWSNPSTYTNWGASQAPVSEDWSYVPGAN